MTKSQVPIRKSNRTLTALSSKIIALNQALSTGKATGNVAFTSRLGILLLCKRRYIIGQPRIRGLYAAQDISKGTVICESEGVTITVKPGTKVENIPRAPGEYLFQTPTPNKYFKSFAATTAYPLNLINAAQITDGDSSPANATLDTLYETHASCTASRSITKGEEILITYGEQYDKLLKREYQGKKTEVKAIRIKNLRSYLTLCERCNRNILRSKYQRHFRGHDLVSLSKT